MDTSRVYVDFEPSNEWVREEDCDTLLLYLEGFKREQLRAQLTTTRNLNISGERPLGNNKWRRFQKIFSISENCDTNKITAKFEDGILIVKQPKLITPAQKQDQEKPISEAPKRTDDPQPPQKNDQQPTSKLPDMANRGNEKAADGLAAPKANTVPGKPQDQKDTIANGKRSDREKTDGKDVSPNITDQDKAKTSVVNTGKETRKTSEKITEQDKDKTSVVNTGKETRKSSEKITDQDKEKSDVITGKEGNITTKQVPTASLNANAAAGKEADAALPKLKIPNKLVNLVLVLLCVAVLGLYVTNSIRSYKKPEK